MTQPAHRRLVTEAAGNDTYADRNTTDTELAAKIDRTEAAASFARPRDLPAPGRGAVVFIWDDGHQSVWTHLRPLLQAHPHQRHAFAIYVDGLDINMDADQVSTLADEGHEICSHASTANPHIKDLLPAERAFEYDNSQQVLEQVTGKPVTTWVYPNGRNSRSFLTDRELFLRYGRVMSNVGGLPLTIPGQTGHYIRRQHWTNDTHAQVMAAIRSVAESGMTVCLSGHNPINNPDTDKIAEAMQLVDDLGIQTLLPREAFPSPAGRVLNPNFEGDAAWSVATSGTGAGGVETTNLPPGMRGTQAMRLYSTEAGASDWAYAHQMIPVVPGETYTFAALVRGTKVGTGSDVALRINAFDWDPAGSGDQSVGPAQAVTSEWAPILMDFTAGPEQTIVRIELRIPPSHGGEVWYSRVSFAPKRFGVFV